MDAPPRTRNEPKLEELAHHEGIAGERHATLLSCPDCHGVMMRLDEPALLHFECQTGHAYSPLALDTAQVADLGRALMAALRGLRERAMLAYMRVENARRRRSLQEVSDLEELARAYEAHANEVDAVLATLDVSVDDPPASPSPVGAGR